MGFAKNFNACKTTCKKVFFRSIHYERTEEFEELSDEDLAQHKKDLAKVAEEIITAETTQNGAGVSYNVFDLITLYAFTV